MKRPLHLGSDLLLDLRCSPLIAVAFWLPGREPDHPSEQFDVRPDGSFPPFNAPRSYVSPHHHHLPEPGLFQSCSDRAWGGNMLTARTSKITEERHEYKLITSEVFKNSLDHFWDPLFIFSWYQRTHKIKNYLPVKGLWQKMKKNNLTNTSSSKAKSTQ